jgi:hypothetical protein
VADYPSHLRRFLCVIDTGINFDQSRKNLSQPLRSLAATKFCMATNFGSAGRPALSQEESFMADDMEKKNQQGGQSGQGQQSGQSGQHGQQGGQSGQGQQSGQSGQNQPKKGGQTQDENEEDQNRDRQRRAS